MVSSRHLLWLLPTFITPVFSQTFTNCDPMNKTCPADPAFGTDYTFNFTSAPKDGLWNVTAGTINYNSPNGAEFTINKKGDSPTIQSNFYIFGGRVEVHMKSAPGTGIISSIVLESDDLDEVDWEFIGGNNSVAETNYFGKGNTTSYNRATYVPVTTPNDVFHNYTTTWTSDKLEWFIDGQLVRTLNQPDADDNGYNYPQTPMYVRIGVWAGGDPTENAEGTVQWAQGETDYSKGPFTMYVSQARITDYSTGSEYTYGDKSGSWDSIKITAGNSTAKNLINEKPAETTAQKWAHTSSAVKISVYSASAAVVVGAAAVFGLFCLKRRRAGKRQRLSDDEKYEQDRLEMQGLREEYQRNASLSGKSAYTGVTRDVTPRNDSQIRGFQQDPFADRRGDDSPRVGHGFVN